MSGRQTTHDNHTVPQFYLRKWSNNGNTVNCYNTVRHNRGQKMWASSSIKNASVWRDIYTQAIDGHDDDSIERFLCDCEEKASAAIRTLESDVEIDESELKALVDFAIAQMVRTPKWLAEQNDVIASSFASTSEDAFQKLLEQAAIGDLVPNDRFSKSQAESSTSPFPPPPLDISLDDERNAIVSVLSVGQRSSLYAMGRVLRGSVAETMRSYSWVLLETPSNMELPTSDDPFVRLKLLPSGRYSIRCGVGEPGALLFMPITPRFLLATAVGCKRLNQSLLKNSAYYELVYRAIVENAYRYVYSLKRDNAIEVIRPSVVDPKYLQELNETKKRWFGT